MTRDDERLPAGPWCEDCGYQLDRRRLLKGMGFASLMALTGLGVPNQLAIAMTPMPTRARRILAGNPAYPLPSGRYFEWCVGH